MKHEQLSEKYAQHLVDRMDVKELMTIAFEFLEKEFRENYTPEELITDVTDNAPELLEE